jgi:hypothetical protein
MRNPFLKEDGADPVKDALELEEPEVKEEVGEEEPENALFDGPDEDEEVTEEIDEDNELFEGDDEPEVPKGWTKGTYDRFRQVIGQRNELRAEKAQAAAAVKALQDAVDSNKGIVSIIAEKYGKFENPAAMVAADAAFMDAVEELGKTNPEVARFGAAIQHFLTTGEAPKMADGTTPTIPAVTPKKDETPREDPRITKILEGNARKSIKETLAGLDVKPAFRAIIADAVLKTDGLDLAALEEPQVVELAKAFIKEKGFTAADILATPQKESGEKGGKKPKAGGKAGVGTKVADQRTRGKKADETPEGPKDVDEWNARREERRASFIRETLSD